MAAEAGLGGVDDPIGRVFALLGHYRNQLVATDCFFGCPIGNLALELHEPDPRIRDLLAVNFDNWTTAIERCLNDAGDRLPRDLDRRRLAEFTLTVMEGAVMQARTYREIESFDRNVAVLREHFDLLADMAKKEKAPA